eukprot:131890_1
MGSLIPDETFTDKMRVISEISGAEQTSQAHEQQALLMAIHMVASEDKIAKLRKILEDESKSRLLPGSYEDACYYTLRNPGAAHEGFLAPVAAIMTHGPLS